MGLGTQQFLGLDVVGDGGNDDGDGGLGLGMSNEVALDTMELLRNNFPGVCSVRSMINSSIADSFCLLLQVTVLLNNSIDKSLNQVFYYY